MCWFFTELEIFSTLFLTQNHSWLCLPLTVYATFCISSFNISERRSGLHKMHLSAGSLVSVPLAVGLVLFSFCKSDLTFKRRERHREGPRQEGDGRTMLRIDWEEIRRQWVKCKWSKIVCVCVCARPCRNAETTNPQIKLVWPKIAACGLRRHIPKVCPQAARVVVCHPVSAFTQKKSSSS